VLLEQNILRQNSTRNLPNFEESNKTWSRTSDNGSIKSAQVNNKSIDRAINTPVFRGPGLRLSTTFCATFLPNNDAARIPKIILKIVTTIMLDFSTVLNFVL